MLGPGLKIPGAHKYGRNEHHHLCFATTGLKRENDRAAAFVSAPHPATIPSDRIDGDDPGCRWHRGRARIRMRFHAAQRPIISVGRFERFERHVPILSQCERRSCNVCTTGTISSFNNGRVKRDEKRLGRCVPLPSAPARELRPRARLTGSRRASRHRRHMRGDRHPRARWSCARSPGRRRPRPAPRRSSIGRAGAIRRGRARRSAPC